MGHSDFIHFCVLMEGKARKEGNNPMSKYENEIVVFQNPKSEEDIKLPEIVPILPVRNTVLFPFSMLPLTVGRESSTKIIEDVTSSDSRYVGVIAQRDPSLDNPHAIDLFA